MAITSTIKVEPEHKVKIPKKVANFLNLEVGESLKVIIHNGAVIMVPLKTISKDQLWFWTKEWQEKEKEAEKDIQKGRVKVFDDVEELIEELNS